MKTALTSLLLAGLLTLAAPQGRAQTSTIELLPTNQTYPTIQVYPYDAGGTVVNMIPFSGNPAFAPGNRTATFGRIYQIYPAGPLPASLQYLAPRQVAGYVTYLNATGYSAYPIYPYFQPQRTYLYTVGSSTPFIIESVTSPAIYPGYQTVVAGY